jgi:hypothetical protein
VRRMRRTRARDQPRAYGFSAGSAGTPWCSEKAWAALL